MPKTNKFVIKRVIIITTNTVNLKPENVDSSDDSVISSTLSVEKLIKLAPNEPPTLEHTDNY